MARQSDGHRHRRGGPRRHGERGPSGRRRQDRLRIGTPGDAGDGPRGRSTRGRSGPSSPPPRRSSTLWPPQPRAGPRASRRRRPLAGGTRPRARGADAGRGPRRRDQGDDRAEDDPGPLLGDPRHPPGEPRPVPGGGRPDRVAPVARPDLRQLLGPAAGGRPRADRRRRPGHGPGRGGSRRPSSPAAITAVDSIVDEATRNVQVQATLPNPRRHAPPRDVRRGRGAPRDERRR